MRHAATILLAATLALAGCSSGGHTDAKPSPTPTTDPGDKFVMSVIDAHLDSYATGVPAVPPANELKQFPPKWCEALEAGHSVKWMLSIRGGDLYPVGETWGTEQTDAYRLVLLGVQAYCPRWEKTVRQELRDSGEY
ncbi:hypothetical protein ACFWIO_18965 [Streptomyces diastatochromogenes]|uniref:hypothetical protein n=1 Tax=Streptomyces diastatochromogenes TaxID=42236 RepID=UPI0036620A41